MEEQAQTTGRTSTRVGTPRASWFGYLVVLLGSVTFVVGCFLPFYGPDVQPGFSQPEFTVSLYQVIGPGLNSDRDVAYYGGLLYLFSGAAIVGGLSIIGLRRVPPRWLAVTLAAAVATWSLMWIGVLLSTLRADSPRIGYWTVFTGVCVVAAATALVIWSTRRTGAQNLLDA